MDKIVSAAKNKYFISFLFFTRHFTWPFTLLIFQQLLIRAIQQRNIAY